MLATLKNDDLGQVTSGKKYWSDGTPVAGQRFEYSFDGIGNRTQTKSGGDANGANLRQADYTANSLNQYTSRDVPGYVDILGISIATNTVTVGGQTAYRKGEYFRGELSVNNSSTALWTNILVTATGQTSVTGNVFVAKTNEVFGYDLDGNLTNDGRWLFTWDAENRLTQVESKSGAPTGSVRKVVWEFDSKGRRIRQTTYDGSSGTNVVTEDLKFVNDGWRCLAELNSTNNFLVRRYAWGLDVSGSMDGAGGVGGLLWMKAGPAAQFCAYDGNGNVVGMVRGSDGLQTASYEYDPFGQTIRKTGLFAQSNPFRFSTKRTDNTTDFALYEYRVYKPSTGSWGSRDPINEIGAFLIRSGISVFLTGLRDSPPVGDGVDIDANKFLIGMGGNVFAINGNDVQNFVDYFGLAPFCVCIRAHSDHSWIMVTDLATGEVHSYGRYKMSYGNPPADHSGVHKDTDLRRSYSAERCTKVDNYTPTINKGYDLYNNNCATYAWSEWKKVSGEDLGKASLGSFTYDHPDVLKDSILKINKEKPRKECECAKPPAKKQ